MLYIGKIRSILFIMLALLQFTHLRMFIFYIIMSIQTTFTFSDNAHIQNKRQNISPFSFNACEVNKVIISCNCVIFPQCVYVVVLHRVLESLIAFLQIIYYRSYLESLNRKKSQTLLVTVFYVWLETVFLVECMAYLHCYTVCILWSCMSSPSKTSGLELHHLLACDHWKWERFKK